MRLKQEMNKIIRIWVRVRVRVKFSSIPKACSIHICNPRIKWVFLECSYWHLSGRLTNNNYYYLHPLMWKSSASQLPVCHWQFLAPFSRVPDLLALHLRRETPPITMYYPFSFTRALTCDQAALFSFFLRSSVALQVMCEPSLTYM